MFETNFASSNRPNKWSLTGLDVLQRLLELVAVLQVGGLLQLVAGVFHLGIGHVDREGLAAEGVLEERVERRLRQFDGELAHESSLVVAGAKLRRCRAMSATPARVSTGADIPRHRV